MTKVMKFASFLVSKYGFSLPLQISLLDGLFFALMVGFGETYLIAFGVAAGVSESLIGLLGSLPLLIGAFVQLISPKAIQKFGSYKKWVLFAAFSQAMSFLPLIFSSMNKTGDFWVVFVSATAYWTSGFAGGPAWNAWIQNLVSAKESAQFFAIRHRLSQWGILAGVIFGGIFLDWQGRKTVGPLFALVFFLALGFRLISVWYLSKLEYRETWYVREDSVGIRQMLKEIWPENRYRSLFLFLFLLYASASISSPFVVPFMLSKLHFSWAQFMVASSVLLLGKLLFLPTAKKIIETKGLRTAFIIGAFGVSPAPILWAFSDHFLYVCLLQMWGGAMWGLLEVSLMLIFFDRIKPIHKTPMLSLYNLFNASAVLTGAAIGGHFLHIWSETSEAYLKVFMLGGFLRLAFAFTLLKTPDLWIRKVPSFFRVFGVRQGFTLSLRSFLEDEVKIETKS